MTTYHVEVVIGTQYLLQVEADNEQQLHDRVDHYDPNYLHGFIVPMENETGRSVISIKEFIEPICQTCQETKTECNVNSVLTGEIVQTFDYIQRYSQLNEDTKEHLSIVLNAYLTHGVSPCNNYSRA